MSKRNLLPSFQFLFRGQYPSIMFLSKFHCVADDILISINSTFNIKNVIKLRKKKKKKMFTFYTSSFSDCSRSLFKNLGILSLIDETLFTVYSASPD